MMDREQRPRRRAIVLSALALLTAGCATTSHDEQTIPFTQEQMRPFTKRARLPAVFGITVYPSDAGPVFAGANRLHAGDEAMLPFKSGGPNPAPIIVMRPGGPGEFPALIDTSSRDSWLDARGAAMANIVPLAAPALFQKRPENVFDEIGGFACVMPKIRLDMLHMENGLLYLRAANGPLGPLCRWEDSPRPNAVMGMNMLRAFSFVQINFKQRQVAFSASSEYRPNEAKLLASLPLRDINGALATDGAVDSEPAAIILDTAGDFEFSVKEVENPTIRQVSIGDVVFRNIAAQSNYEKGLGLQEHPRLGRRALSRFTITLDFKKRLIHVERP